MGQNQPGNIRDNRNRLVCCLLWMHQLGLMHGADGLLVLWEREGPHVVSAAR